MKPIVNNLKYYDNESPWHRHNFSNPFDTSPHFQTEYFLGRANKIRTTFPKTESISRSHLHGSQSRCKYFDEKEDPISKSRGRVEVKRKLFKESDTQQSRSSYKRTQETQRTPDKRKRIFSNNKSSSKLERNKNIQLIKRNAAQMRINELFFCQKCYLYLFKMELDYHYPECTNDYNKLKIKTEDLRRIGESKLQRLEYALQYTNSRMKERVCDLVQRIKKGKVQEFYIDHSNEGLLLLSDAEVAAKLISNRFFR